MFPSRVLAAAAAAFSLFFFCILFFFLFESNFFSAQYLATTTDNVSGSMKCHPSWSKMPPGMMSLQMTCKPYIIAKKIGLKGMFCLTKIEYSENDYLKKKGKRRKRKRSKKKKNKKPKKK